MTTTQPAILSRALVLRFVSVAASSIGFYLPLAVIPMFADAAGSRTAAGLANGALLVATVAGELATPRLLARFGYRRALAAGLVLLGAPTLLLLASSSLVVIVLVNAIRGIGFAVTVVAGGALTVTLIPTQRRAEGLAIVGLVGGIPSLIALPFGTWAASRFDFDVVFVLAAAAPLAAVATVAGLGRRDMNAAPQHGVAHGLRNGAITGPAVIFAASAAAAGVVVTYVPLAVTARAAWMALLVQPAAATAGRWIAGRLGDRRGQVDLLVPGLALSVTGMTAIAITTSTTLVIAGAAVFGVGFGVLQNATLSLMYARVPAAGYGAVSAIWNAGYDAGMAAGAIGVGMLVTTTGFSLAFLTTAAAMLPALLLARRTAAPASDASRTAELDLPSPADQRAPRNSSHNNVASRNRRPAPSAGPQRSYRPTSEGVAGTYDTGTTRTCAV